MQHADNIYSQDEIDRSFDVLSAQIKSTSKASKGTHQRDVLLYLFENPQKIWWMSWELRGGVTSEGIILSHRADARASELATFDSQLVERRMIGRFAAYRLRTENIHLVRARLGTNKPQPAEREQVPEKPHQPTCKHGLPTFVQCPDCKKENHA